MTIQGAITELQDLLKANDVPLYYKGGIRKVIKTISMEFVERNRRIEALEHRLELHERAMAKAIQDEAQTHDICTNTHECVKDTHDKTEPTISKMEQVEDEPMTCDNCKLKGTTKWCNNQVVCRAYEPKDEPQTEREGE